MIPEEILREYDIRGVFGQNLTLDIAHKIGRGFGLYLKESAQKTSVAVGFDGRHSSPILVLGLIKGLMSTGMNVTNIGLGPTPMLYFMAHLRCDAGIMVTGSHNPSNENGFKFYIKDEDFFGEKIKNLNNILAQDKGEILNGNTQFEANSPLLYSDYLAKFYKNSGKYLKIAFDSGSGASGTIVEILNKKLGFNSALLYTKIDGDFPGHHPDPSVPKNLQELCDLVKANSLDLGIAFDGDGDRIGVVDNLSRIIPGDILLQIFAKDLLKTNPGAKIIGDVKCSDSVFTEIKKLGGQAIMWKTGHSNIKKKMRLEGAALAGEMSGHIFFQENNGFDDGLFAAIKLLNLVQSSGKTLAELFDEVPKTYSTDETRIEVPDDKKFAIIDDIKAQLDKMGIKYNDIDGVRVREPGGWWLIRASNTQGAIIIRAESSSQEGLNNLIVKINEILEKAGIEEKLW